jgi:hypothetical protein
VSKKKPHFVRRLSVFLGVLAASKLKVSRHKKKILAGRLGLDPLVHECDDDFFHWFKEIFKRSLRKRGVAGLI